jgi:spermidine synthase
MTNNNFDIQVDQNSIPTTNERIGIKVLIVEDDLMNQTVIKRFLEKRFDTIITDSSDNVVPSQNYILYKNQFLF